MLFVSGKRHKRLQEDYDRAAKSVDELSRRTRTLDELLDKAERDLAELPRRGPHGRFEPRSDHR